MAFAVAGNPNLQSIPAKPSIPKYNDFQYLVAYALITLIWMLFARTSRFGYVTTYYLLLMLAFVLVLLNSNTIVKLLAPISGNQ